MSIIIHPYEGIEIKNIGMIRFGMTREEAKSVLKDQECKTFLKGELEDGDIAADGYFENDLQLLYKKPGIIEAIEMAPGVGEVFFKGKDILFDISHERANKWIKQKDPNSELTKNGSAISSKFGILIGLKIDDPLEDDYFIPQSVLVFDKEYYKKYRNLFLGN